MANSLFAKKHFLMGPKTVLNRFRMSRFLKQIFPADFSLDFLFYLLFLRLSTRVSENLGEFPKKRVGEPLTSNFSIGTEDSNPFFSNQLVFQKSVKR